MSKQATGLTRYGARRAEIAALMDELGEPAYRSAQVWECLWEQRRPLDEASNVPKALRARVADALPLALDAAVELHGDEGLTLKWLWSCASDGAQVETVLMRYPAGTDGDHRDRATVCVSSQAGCAMACSFCATGQAGFERHLRADEIVEQVVRAQHACEQRVSNVVFMGMGEPLANVEPVLESVERIQGDLGISARRITVSTVGVVPGMRRLAEHPLPVTLAVSLHAPDDPLREQLVPLTRQYPIAAVLDAARDYAAGSGRRVTFEYACIEGVNDRPAQAEALAGRLVAFPGGAHVNLIPLNPTVGYRGRTPADDRLQTFAERLRSRGMTVTIRRNRGLDIDAACGQLRTREAKAV